MKMSITEALEWEKQALLNVLVDHTPRFLVWEPIENVMVLPASSKWQATPELTDHMAKFGWQIEQRKTGGSPVPQAPGVINLPEICLSSNHSVELYVSQIKAWLVFL